MMKPLHKLALGVLALLTGLSFQALAADPAALERSRQFKEQEMAIYGHMKQYGINRDDVAAMRRLYETSPPYSYPHVSVATENLLKPGEHYRIEMDEYVLTMKVPDGNPVSGNWIWPYTNTRQPDPGMEKFLKQSAGTLKVANLGWYACNSIFPPGLFGRCEIMGVSMTYRIVKPEDRGHLSTPENMRAVLEKNQRGWIPTQQDIDKTIREGLIDNRIGNQIVQPPEPVVINGRIWIRDSMNDRHNRSYFYSTYLQPDRALVVRFGLPQYDYQADPDLSAYPGWIRRAFAQQQEMIASLRIAKTNDDGQPDPFVVERVEVAPLPVREKLPSPPE